MSKSLRYVDSFDFPSSFGFKGSSQGTDGPMAPGNVNYEELETPAMIRRNRTQTVEAMKNSGVEMLDIPAFLRKQAD